MSPLSSPGVLCRMDSVQGLSSLPVRTDVKMGSPCLPGSHCSQCEGPDEGWSDWERPEGLRCGGLVLSTPCFTAQTCPVTLHCSLAQTKLQIFVPLESWAALYHWVRDRSSVSGSAGNPIPAECSLLTTCRSYMLWLVGVWLFEAAVPNV